MTEDQFHEFGQLSGAPAVPPGASSAESLGVRDADVQREIESICGGGGFIFPPFLWPALPHDVPAYEQFFAELSQSCFVLESRMERLRANAANRMALNHLQQTGVNPTDDATHQFCDLLNRNRDITASLLSQALEGAELIPERTGKLAEIGIALVIASCSNLISYLD